MEKHTRSVPVKLQYWPSCHDCLDASDDAIAVACGEMVHVLSPRSNSASQETGVHPQWNVSTMQVNIFSELEWSYQTLAPTRDLSLGEEQSESVVCNVAWSSPELGAHKRAVLGILTTNLVLSLWETDGSSGQYRRTCVINHALASEALDATGVEADRRSRRVRAFAWVTPIKQADLHQDGGGQLAIADDNDILTILHLSRSSSTSSGDWSVAKIQHLALKEMFQTSTNTMSMSSLQQSLEQKSPISSIKHTRWTQSGAHVAQNQDAAFLSYIIVSKGPTTCSVVLKSNRQLIKGGLLEMELSGKVEAQFTNARNLQDDGRQWNPDQWQYPELGLAPMQEFFSEPLQEVCAAFDGEFNLHGAYQVRFWGISRIPGREGFAACLTLHPSDMLEHTTSSSQKCTIIFKHTNQDSHTRAGQFKSGKEVQKRVLSFVARYIRKSIRVSSPLDKRMLAIQGAIAQTPNGNAVYANEINACLKASISENEAASSRLEGVTAGQGSARSPYDETESINLPPGLAVAEICEICLAPIPFSSDTTSATCVSGHQFTRCNLSFIALQEPGISKYCSGCRKQFLDLVKIGMPEGQSFAQALFDEFDICPYCRAKYRG